MAAASSTELAAKGMHGNIALGVAKVALVLSALAGAMYGTLAGMKMGPTGVVTLATVKAIHVTVSQGADWHYLVFAAASLLLAAAAYVKSRTNQNTAVLAATKATETGTKVDTLTDQVNGSLSQTQERVARLEGLAGLAVQARDPISPVIDPLPTGGLQTR